MAKTSKTSKRSLKEQPTTVDLFADGAAGLFLFNGNLRITLETNRADHGTTPPTTNHFVVARLVMPVAGAEAMARGILKSIGSHKPSSPRTGGTGSATMQ
jgi:hypothetical protein